MSIRLKADVIISVGLGAQPVDLVCKSTGKRVPLSQDEAAIAMLLTDGQIGDVDELALIAQAHGVGFSPGLLTKFVAYLQRAEMVEILGRDEFGGEDTLSDEGTPPADEWDDADEKQTVVWKSEHGLPGAGGPPDLPALLSGAPVERQAPEESVRPPPVPPPPPQLSPPALEQPSKKRPLAMAAQLICAKRYVEAKEILELFLEGEPENIQAAAMLELIGTVSSAVTKPARPRRARRVLWVAGPMMVILVGVIGAGLVIRRPQSLTLPCHASRVTTAAVEAPIAGTVTMIAASDEQLVQQGAPLMLIADLDAERQKADAVAQLKSDQDLLRIMQTGGSDEIERTQKQLRAQIELRLAELPPTCAEETPCRRTRERLTRELDRTKEKLKYCEWQALPKEVKATEEKIARQQLELQQLSKRKIRQEVKVPSTGLVKIIVGKDTRVKPATKLAEIQDHGELRVVVKAAGNRGASAASARVLLDGAPFAGQAMRAFKPDGLQLSVRTDVRQVRSEARCMVELDMGTISLLRALVQGTSARATERPGAAR